MLAFGIQSCRLAQYGTISHGPLNLHLAWNSLTDTTEGTAARTAELNRWMLDTT